MKRIKVDFPRLNTRRNDESKSANEVSVADFTLRALRENGERGLTHDVIANAWKCGDKQGDLLEIEKAQSTAKLAATLAENIAKAEASGKAVDGEAPFAFDDKLKKSRS